MSAVTLEEEHPFALIASDLLEQGFSIRDHQIPIDLSHGLEERARSAENRLFHRAGIGRMLDYERDLTTRCDEIHWLSAEHPVENAWLKYMSDLQLYLNRTLFLGLFSYECHFARYPKGAFYKKHLDAFQGETNRVLTTVFYLNKEWDKSQGGELVMYSAKKTNEEICRILPKYGRLCVFLSEEFPHEVLPVIAGYRLSIAGWFRVNGSFAGAIDPPS